MSSRTASVLTAMTLTLSLAALACSREQPSPTPSQAADEQQGDEPAAAPEGAEAQPKIAVDEPEHTFGKIGPKQTAEHVFTIKNVGDADLVIDRVQKT